MPVSMHEFEGCVSAVVSRFLAQNGRAAPPQAVRRLAAQLAKTVATHGLPRPLEPGETGAPGSLPEEELARLLAETLSGIAEPELADVGKQLVKACFYPEFTVCRDSYREVGRDGRCRRQELERARGRVSGAHCVDCPHWTALAPAEHQELLANAWCGERAAFHDRRAVFLPEDFRALRHWLHRAAREGMAGSAASP
jgi:hypothetical protein